MVPPRWTCWSRWVFSLFSPCGPAEGQENVVQQVKNLLASDVVQTVRLTLHCLLVRRADVVGLEEKGYRGRRGSWLGVPPRRRHH